MNALHFLFPVIFSSFLWLLPNYVKLRMIIFTIKTTFSFVLVMPLEWMCRICIGPMYTKKYLGLMHICSGSISLALVSGLE